MAFDEKFLPKHPHSICQVILSFAEGGIITPLRICLTSSLFWYWFEILYLCFAWPRIMNQLRTGTCISGSGNCFFSRKDDSPIVNLFKDIQSWTDNINQWIYWFIAEIRIDKVYYAVATISWKLTTCRSRPMATLSLWLLICCYIYKYFQTIKLCLNNDWHIYWSLCWGGSFVPELGIIKYGCLILT